MPKGLRKIEVSFEEPPLTHFAGMCLIQWFCQTLGLRRWLQRQLRPAPRSRESQPADMLLAIPDATIAGMDRVNATQTLPYKGAVQKLGGLHRFPDQPAIRRLLKRLPPPPLRQIVRGHARRRHRLFDRPPPRTSLVFDLDSTVRVVYGRLGEGARVGSNPKQRGRRSSPPLLACESRSQAVWHGS